MKHISLKADGGAAANSFLMQFQADILGTGIDRPRMLENTALGAAYLSGLVSGFWKNKKEITERMSIDRRFEPSLKEEEREKLIRGWKRAVKTAIDWTTEE